MAVLAELVEELVAGVAAEASFEEVSAFLVALESDWFWLAGGRACAQRLQLPQRSERATSNANDHFLGLRTMEFPPPRRNAGIIAEKEEQVKVEEEQSRWSSGQDRQRRKPAGWIAQRELAC